MGINVLQVLDQMDKFRRTHQDARQNTPDYCMRMMEAMLAKSAGYQSRNDWTDALKADSTTTYSKEYNDLTFRNF